MTARRPPVVPYVPPGTAPLPPAPQPPGRYDAYFAQSAEADLLGADIAAFLDGPEEDPATAWLVRGLIGAGVPGVIAGPPKSRKSWLMYYLAICIASGRRALGRDTRQGRVMIISREDSAGEIRRRMRRLARGLGIDLASLKGSVRIVDASEIVLLDDLRSVEEFQATIDAYKPIAVFIDNLSRVHRANENDRTEMNKVTDTWSTLAFANECAVVMLHHYSKSAQGGPGQRMRGTGDLFAVARVTLGVEATAIDTVKIDVEGNLPECAEPFAVRFADVKIVDADAVTLTAISAGEQRAQTETAAVRDLRREVIQAFNGVGSFGSKSALAKTVGGNKAKALAAINGLLSNGTLMVDPGSGLISIRDPAAVIAEAIGP